MGLRKDEYPLVLLWFKLVIERRPVMYSNIWIMSYNSFSYFYYKTIWWKPLLIAHILLQLRPLLPFTGSPSPAFIRDQLHAFDLPLDMLITLVTWENVIIPPDDTMDDDNVWRDSLTYKSNMLLLPSSCNSVLPPPLNDNRIPPDSQCVEKVLENRNNLSLTPQYWSVERI